MKSEIYHIDINVSDIKKSGEFYKKMLGAMGYDEIHEYPDTVGIGKKDGGNWFWLHQVTEPYVKDGYHRKRIGMNHIAFGLENKEAVDAFVEHFLKANSVPALYETPRAFPEYTPTYYAVFFEDPDRIKIEVASNS